MPALAFVGVIVANITLAFGPWLVRMADVGPATAAFWRIALAVPVLTGAALLLQRRPFAAASGLWGIIAVAGLAFAADLASWHFGIHRTTLANATLFGNSTSLIYPVYGFLVARSWPSRPQTFALLLAITGTAVLLGRSAQLSPRNLAGDLLCLLAGGLYALYFILMARARDRMAPLPVLAIASLMALAPLLVLALALGERVLPGDWTPLIALALGSQVLGQGLMIYVLRHLSPLVIGITLLIQPAIAATIDWLAYGERLTVVDALGAVLIGAALVLVRRGRTTPVELAPPGEATKS